MNKKKYIIWRIALPVLLISLVFSCSDDFFETDTGGRITPEQHYNSFIDAQLSFAGCFIYLQDIAENMILVDGLRSDQMNVTKNADRDMVDLVRHEVSANNPYINPSNFYKLIININEVLPNLPQIMEKDRDYDSTLNAIYTGSLITMRGWAYFQLAKLNNRVGLVDGNLSSVDASEIPEYVDKAEMIDRIIDELLPYYDEDDVFRYSFDHYVLLGELYLEKGNYVEAAKYLKYSCDGPAFRNVFMLGRDYSLDAWYEIFLSSTNRGSTVRTAVPYSFVEGQKNSLEEWMHYDYNFMVEPVQSLVDEFKTEISQIGDPGDEFRGVGFTYDTTESGVNYISKYSQDLGIAHSADVILYRAADIHLMLAEALNRLGQTTNALALLNKGFGGMAAGDRPSEYTKWSTNKGVRGRVFLEDKTIPEGVENPMEYLEDLIIEERAKELAFEGKRWFDLVRIANRRNDPSYLANRVAAKFEDAATAEYVKTKLMNPENWYVPLPEVQAK